MRQIDIYKELAQQSEITLLAFAAVKSHRRDLQSLRDCLSVLNETGSTVGLLINSQEIPVSLATAHSDMHSMTGVYADARSSFARIFLQAVLPLSNPFSNQSHLPQQKSHSYSAPVSDEGIDFLREVIALGAPGSDSHAFGAPGYRIKFLSLMLFNAASLTDDLRVFKLLTDAGASAQYKFISRHPLIKSEALTAYEEAWLHKNFSAAAFLCTQAEPASVVQSIQGMVHGDGDFMQHIPGDTSAQGFYKNMFAKLINMALQEKRYSHVQAMIDAICSKIDAHDALEPTNQGLALQFRILLLSSYLRSCAESWRCPWEPEALMALAGDEVMHANQSLISLEMQAWMSHGVGPEKHTGATHAWDFSIKAPARTMNFTDPRADLVYQALRTHCLPVLLLAKPALKSLSTTQNPGIGVQTVIDPCLIEDAPVLVAAHYKNTLALLMECGHTISGPLKGVRSSGNALHLVARLGALIITAKLPALLSLGANSDFMDASGKTPCQAISGKEDRKVWMGIEKAFGARRMALNVLDDIEAEMAQTLALETPFPKAPRRLMA